MPRAAAPQPNAAAPARRDTAAAAGREGVDRVLRVTADSLNRLLLAIKHFPLSVLWLNGFYWIARMAAGVSAALRGRGEAGRFPGIAGKLRLAFALFKGIAEALVLIPRTLRKRRSLRPLRRLTPKQVRHLLWQYKIPLRTLTEQAI